MIVMLLLSIVLILIILILLFSMCFCVRRPVEYYRLCAKLPSMPRGYLADFKLSFRHAMLKPKGRYIVVIWSFKATVNKIKNIIKIMYLIAYFLYI